MATSNRVTRGPVADRVARNIRELREERRLTLDDLSTRLQELGHPILKSGLSKIETGSRRVDADDLAALAVALEVNTNRLILGPDAATDDQIELSPGLAVTSKSAWHWACGEASDDAGAWPWAKFAKNGGDPIELFRFLTETRPHDPPVRLSAEEWEQLTRWRDAYNRLYFEMLNEGVRPEQIVALLRMLTGAWTFHGEEAGDD